MVRSCGSVIFPHENRCGGGESVPGRRLDRDISDIFILLYNIKSIVSCNRGK